MSAANGDEQSGLEQSLRTVTPITTERPNLQMNLFGYLIVIPIVLLLLPLLPFVALWWVGSKALSALRGE